MQKALSIHPLFNTTVVEYMKSKSLHEVTSLFFFLDRIDSSLIGNKDKEIIKNLKTYIGINMIEKQIQL